VKREPSMSRGTQTDQWRWGSQTGSHFTGSQVRVLPIPYIKLEMSNVIYKPASYLLYAWPAKLHQNYLFRWLWWECNHPKTFSKLCLNWVFYTLYRTRLSLNLVCNVRVLCNTASESVVYTGTLAFGRWPNQRMHSMQSGKRLTFECLPKLYRLTWIDSAHLHLVIASLWKKGVWLFMV
jgi:hypothetical protein